MFCKKIFFAAGRRCLVRHQKETGLLSMKMCFFAYMQKRRFKIDQEKEKTSFGILSRQFWYYITNFLQVVYYNLFEYFHCLNEFMKDDGKFSLPW